MFRIAAFAHMSGLSPKVLRDYDAAGIFRPAWVDRATGYRMYTPAQLPELRRIISLRDAGVGLADLRALVESRADLRSVLEVRIAALEAARADMDRRIAGLGIAMAEAAAGGAGSSRSVDVVVRQVPGELVATMDASVVDGDVGRAFYELERRIRDAGIRAPRPPGAIVDAPGGPDVEVFVPVRRAAAGPETRRLSPIRAATALHHGSYATIGGTTRALERWVARAGLRPTGPRRVVYLQFGAEADLRLPGSFVVDAERDMLTELQVPV